MHYVFSDYYILKKAYDSGNIEHKKAKAAFEKIAKIELKIRELAKENKESITDKDLGDVFYKYYASFGVSEDRKIERAEFLADNLWEIEKQLTEIIEVSSGAITDVIDGIHSQIGEKKKNPTHGGMVSNRTGIPIENNNPTLEGTFSPKKTQAALDRLFGGGNPFTSTTDEEFESQVSQILTTLVRINNYGRTVNGTKNPSYKDLLYNLKKISDQKAKSSDNVTNAYASTPAQIRASIQILGFLTDNGNNVDLKKKKSKGRWANTDVSIFYNAINVLGYAGGGKTTQIVNDVLSVWQRVADPKVRKSRKVLYVGSSDDLIADFVSSSKGIMESDDQIKTVLLEDFAAFDTSGYELIVFDEGSLLESTELKDIQTKTQKNNNKIIFLSDDNQVSSSKGINPDNHLYNLAERTVPVTEVFRTGVVQFVDFVNMIRSRRGEEKRFRMESILSYKKKDGDP